MRAQRVLSKSLMEEYSEIASAWAAWTKAIAEHTQQVARSGYYLMKSVKAYRDELEQAELEEAIFAEEDQEEAAALQAKRAAEEAAREAAERIIEPRAWDKAWKLLTEGERQAAAEVGLTTRELWDDGETLIKDFAWASLSADHGAAAETLGLTKQSWYYGIISGSYGYYVSGAQGARLHARHFDHYGESEADVDYYGETESDDISPEDRARAVQAGIMDRTGLFWTPWDELSMEQRSLAAEFGHPFLDEVDTEMQGSE